MKKFILFLLLSHSALIYSQEDVYGGTPIRGLKPIKRTEAQSNLEPVKKGSNLTTLPSVSPPTGSSTEVGVTEGQLSVSLTGGAAYNIPIAVPPGINGIVPQVSLGYNSQGGNGLAGYGWNITGVSVISRTSTTKFHDNIIDGVDFNSLDRFSFDGQRLMVKNGTSGIYGANGTVYETEAFSNVQVTSYGVHPNGSNYGPAYFIVQYPDGSIAHYGNSTNSRSLTDWAITYWQNPQGVRISYSYLLANNNLSISTIKYGTRLTTAPINEILFEYKNRVRPEQAYIGGQSFTRNNILSEIKVKGNGIGFRNYILGHESTTLGYERLKRITEKSGDNSKSFNPTVFNYETTGEAISFIDNVSLSGISNIRADNSATISGDFDGDGNLDFILYPTTGNEAKKKYYLFTSDNLNSGVDFGWEHNVGTFSDIFPTSWLNYSDKLMPMQGWCAVQFNNTTGQTTFKNLSTSPSQPILFQYDKVYAFPKLSYYDACPGLIHCDVLPNANKTAYDEDETGKNVLDKINEPVSARGNEPVIEDPFDGGPVVNPTICPSPSNLAVSAILNGQAIFSWTQSGTPLPLMWEVCYFETNSAPAPSNYEPVGTYIIVNQNSFTAQNLLGKKNYSFFVRSICGTDNLPGNWIGPFTTGGAIIANPGVTKYKDIPKEYVSGDFNGDGLTDVIAIEKSTSYEVKTCQSDCYTSTNVDVSGGKTYFVNLDRRLISNFVNYSGNIISSNSSKFYVADFNGDGKSDLFVFDASICRVYQLGNNNVLSLITTVNSPNITLTKQPLMGDYNGDGKADFIIPKENYSPLFTTYTSTGSTILFTETNLGIDSYFTGYDDGNKRSVQHIIPNDFNNDGKTDLILTKCNYIETGLIDFVNNNRYISVRYFANKGATFVSSMYTEKTDVNGLNRFPIPILLSFDKANSNKQISFISNSTIYSLISPKDNATDTRLKQITLGNGVKEVISYAALNADCPLNSSCDIVFAPSTYTESYPNFDIKLAAGFQVVSQLEQVSATQYKKQKFDYYGAVTNLEGIGFLGFRALARTNWFNEDTQPISSVTKHDMTRRGAVSESWTALGEVDGNFSMYTPTSFISKSNMTYTNPVLALLPNKVFKLNNPFTVSVNGLDGTSNEVTTSFDNYNNPLSTTSVSKNGSIIEKTETVALEYFPLVSSPTYIVGRLKKKNATLNHDGDTMTGEELYTFNSDHLVSKIQKKGHLTNYLTEDNLYDVFGNITKKTITAVGLTPRITNFTYDLSGRFLMSSKDIEDLTTTYTYNSSNGLLLTQTLPSNPGFPLITTNLYDVWGKKIKETDYLGKSLTTAYSWISPGSSGYFEITSTGDDDSKSIVRLDDLGRKIAEGYKTINDVTGSQSNISWKTNEYDIYNRLIKAYEPSLATQPQWSGLFSTTSYDAYGRPTQVTEPTGKIHNITYSGLTTSTSISYSGSAAATSAGVGNSTAVKNSTGAVVSMTDNEGTITYKHFANGNLKTSNFEGVEVKIEQDGWGRKTKLDDPSAGIYRYEYNEFGEITKEITPKGETNYTINNVGKVTQKTIVGTGGDPTNTKTTYTYNDPTTKLLTNTRYDDFAGGFHTLYTYGYDNYKRLNLTEESGFNAFYQRAIQFDAFGRPARELYTAINTTNGKRSDKWVKNTYKNGQHWQILDDATSQVLWQTNTVNAKGQVVTAAYGNGINITNSYDQFGFPTQFKHDKTGVPSANIMTLNTSFEAQRGNLLSRNNSMFNHQENFTYDNLDRLSTWSANKEILNFTFSNATDGFLATNSGVTVINETTPSYSRLKVTSNLNFQGTQRIIKNNATPGEKLQITGQIYFKTLIGVNNYVKISVVERNPTTNQVIETQYVNATGIDFSVQHTVTQYTEVYIKFVVGNDTNFQGPLSFGVDNIKVIELKTDGQTYDNLGRIDENNVGSYNYTNVNPATNVPKHFQNSSIVPTPEYAAYYQSRAALDITYNAFKSPIDIIEEGKDKISFIYNMNNSRSTMYYGGLQADKLARPFRKHYSTDGSMEIKQIGAVDTEFITYIGGDAYTAPVMLKSNGTTQNYLYLHRDYLGSIVAVTNQAGAVVEKRLFDAWGNVLKVQDGAGNVLTQLTITDRGYTGHEHLQGVNLIHMNGRLYDPVVHRFLQPDNFVADPFSTQAYNRYGYVLNNPLKFSDPSGEFPWTPILIGVMIGAISGGASYVAHAIQTGNWSWDGFGMAIGAGAIIGGITAGLSPMSIFSAGGFGQLITSSFAAGFMPVISVPIGDLTISASPSIVFGNSAGAGVSFGVTYDDGNFSVSGGYGIIEYSNYNGFGANSREIRYSALVSYDDGKTGLTLGTNFWEGDLGQRTGLIGIQSGKFKAMYENDGGFGIKQAGLGDRGDSYRTAALNLSFGDYAAGFNLMTGNRSLENQAAEEKIITGYKRNGKPKLENPTYNPELRDNYNRKFRHGYVNETGTKYRLGALSVGYKGFRAGVNSEHVRHAIQNRFIHNGIKDRGFENLSWNWNSYFQYKTPNMFTSW
ncbi:polymorphic toxin type 23 domain-containing protein [Flavobacterium sp.]|jgi:RHS repeat-associated protein|uniref:polymorphic toxin type 23 domain-containing protein n=1 Tax=Flavobacterium sp. TaxID=239 RepID=UPI0037C0BCC5